ncbi:MAG: peptidoglycan DD-metalloendopeptidase family protein [Oligoflexales bacterium]|nr:peptidoglycan DD-metalloendopeptidase family protein [Oligoflexales bacterium]
MTPPISSSDSPVSNFESIQPPDLPSSVVTLGKRSNVYNLFLKSGISAKEIFEIVNSVRKIYHLNKIKYDVEFLITWSDETKEHPLKVEFDPEPAITVVMKRDNLESKWFAEIINHPVEVQLETFKGTITTSLWDSASNAGMDPVLAGNLASIFAWQIDFNRELKSGDKWRLLVEKLSTKGKSFAWGQILAAEYVNNGTTYTGIKYPQSKYSSTYYAPDGTSLQRMFLRAPLKFIHITSRFSKRRFHPIYRIFRPHNGVDYGAPSGTPILSVGGGKVIFAGWNGDSGLMVKIRHNPTYSSAYMHMSKISKIIKNGSEVEQGQIIGFAGSTGLSTAPHLHFSFYENDRYIDPLGKKFPPADPIPPKNHLAFKKTSEKMLALLPQWEMVLKTNGKDRNGSLFSTK